MKFLTKKWQMVLYGCSGIGLNILNIMVGTYLCSALIADGFVEHASEWTYLNKNLVIASVWAVLALVVKIFDGIIDIPFSNLTDNMRTRWGRRRPAILIGYIPLIISYLLFLIPLTPHESVANTVWFAALLFVFYGSYTLTMVTWYGTFAEILKDEYDRVFVSNIKSVCDVVYFALGFSLLPVFISMNVNIRIIALCALPMALTMLVPLFLIKEPSTLPKDREAMLAKGYTFPEKEVRAGIIKSLAYSFKNKAFIFWLFVVAVMNIGLQLFLNGINEFFSTTGANMAIIMASAFAPIPFTLILYNKVVKMKGIRFAYQYSLVVFSVGMLLMYFVAKFLSFSELFLNLGAVLCGIIASFAIGSFFSITYTIPSHLAAEENKKSGICASSMYFAVQGLFEGVAAGIATGPILVNLKAGHAVQFITLIVALFCMLAFALTFFLPASIAKLGKKNDDKA